MQSIRTKFSVGLFVIIGMSVVILFVLWLGMSEYFRGGRKYAAYFDESVQGLSRDAAVKYRGVNVGQVKQIGVAPDGRLVEIIFTIEKELGNPENLVAQIKSVGITGIMFVELERPRLGEKTKAPDFEEFKPEFPVINTRPSEMKRLLTDINEIISRIKQVDLEGISNRLITMIDSMNRIMAEAELVKISKDLQQVIENTNRILNSEQWEKLGRSANKTAQNLEQLIAETSSVLDRVEKSAASSSREFNKAANRVYKAAENANKLLNEGSVVLDSAQGRASDYDRRIAEIMEELETAAAGLNRLIDQINRQPSRLIYGPPLQEKTIEPEKK
ncbi:MAG: MlaD family protein [Desulfobacteraceae bacterium]|nr:MlaD family protein [Desulfobacteraceae bacterium]